MVVLARAASFSIAGPTRAMLRATAPFICAPASSTAARWSALHGGRGPRGAAVAGSAAPSVAPALGVAQGHDELRDVRRGVDLDLDAVDARGPLGAA